VNTDFVFFHKIPKYQIAGRIWTSLSHTGESEVVALHREGVVSSHLFFEIVKIKNERKQTIKTAINY